MAIISALTAIGAAITGGALSGTAAAVAGGVAAAGAVGGIASGAAGIVSASTQGGKDNGGAVYNAEAEKKKAAMQEAEANKRRALSETNTVRTSALGNTGNTQVQKKTILGG